MSNKNNLSTDEQIQDIINRYNFERCGERCREGKDGTWEQKCMVLTNKKDANKRRYVNWTLYPDGFEEWDVSHLIPIPPKESEGIQRKKPIYISATLRVLQEQFFQNRCKAPRGDITHGQCQRCGGDLICEMECQQNNECHLVCYGRQYGYCDYRAERRCH